MSEIQSPHPDAGVFAHRSAIQSPAPTLLSRTETTMEAIEQYIVANHLQPGDPLPTESALCDSLGVSRSSVREALRQLKALEIVDVQQGRGAFVGDMTLRPLIKTVFLRSSTAPDSAEALSQVLRVRQVLDLGLASEAIQALQGTHDDHLHELVDQMISKAQRSEFFMDEDIEFHTALLKKINNPLAEQLVNAMWMIHMMALPQIHRGFEGLPETARAHEAMLVSAENGDLEGYRRAVFAHYDPLNQALGSLSQEEASSTDKSQLEECGEPKQAPHTPQVRVLFSSLDNCCIQTQNTIGPAVAMVDNAGLHCFFIDKEEEGVPHQFHLIQCLVNAHRNRLMNLLADNNRTISQLLLASFADFQIPRALQGRWSLFNKLRFFSNACGKNI